MSEHLSVDEIDDIELPGALQRLDDTQLTRTVQGLDNNQISRVMLVIKSMSDEQDQRNIQRLDPSNDTRIQNFGTPALPYHSAFKSLTP
jgi:U3 small nucleolar ribonucleoprotein component